MILAQLNLGLTENSAASVGMQYSTALAGQRPRIQSSTLVRRPFDHELSSSAAPTPIPQNPSCCPVLWQPPSDSLYPAMAAALFRTDAGDRPWTRSTLGLSDGTAARAPMTIAI